MAEFEVYLQGGSPWGFRLQGGKEFRIPLKISKVEPGGKAAVGGVKVGDHVTEINGSNTTDMYHTEALTTVKKAQYSLSLVLKRPEESDELGHSIQSISIAPEETKTRVSLTIGSKSAPSSPKGRNKFDHVDNAPRKKSNVPTGQGYMQKLIGDVADDYTLSDDLPPTDRVRSKTLPKSYGKHRQSDQKQQHSLDDASKSLPRNSSSSDGPSNKAPHWYKDMYKQMHTSMEGESHLSKLLSSDAKRGAFRKYDGASTISSGIDYGSMSPEERRKTFESNTLSGAPRRLQGGGRSIATHQHRKSLPNIHASNFNFMSPANYQTPALTATAPNSNASSSSVTMRVNSRKLTRQKSEDNVLEQKPANTENRKSINSEWYRALQKGGDIPESGLASTKPTSKNAITVTSRSQTDAPPKSPKANVGPSSAAGHMQASQYMREKNKVDTYNPKEPTTNTKYNAPVDFLELRKRELKNIELEKEREQIREARERERLEEEARLRKQKEIDRMIVQKEKDNLEPLLTSPGPGQKTPEARRSPVQKTPPKQVPEPEPEPKLSEFGRAKYSFHPQGPGELEFRKGDTIRIIQGIDENWIEGEYDGNIGIFPVSYVELLQDTPPSTPKQVTPPQKKSPQQKHEDLNNNKWFPPKQEVVEQLQTNGYHHPAVEEDIIQQVYNTIDETRKNEPEEKQAERVVGTQQYNLEEGLGKAKYTFRAETDNELSFRKGDMITILKRVDENWYEGELDNQIGIFPSNYIEVIHEPMVVELEPKSEQKPAKSDIDFEQIFNDVLSEPMSPKVKQVEPEPVAPTFYEEEMNRANDTRNHNGYHEEDSSSNVMDDLVGKGEPHRAVFTYKPTNDDEVELKVGDIVHVLEKCDDGWYIGTSQRTGVFGTFPGNYVKVM